MPKETTEQEPYGFDRRRTKEELIRMFRRNAQMFGGLGTATKSTYTGGFEEDKTTENIKRDGQGKVIAHTRTLNGQYQTPDSRWHIGNREECILCGEQLESGHTFCCGFSYSGSFRSPFAEPHKCKPKPAAESGQSGIDYIKS